MRQVSLEPRLSAALSLGSRLAPGVLCQGSAREEKDRRSGDLSFGPGNWPAKSVRVVAGQDQLMMLVFACTELDSYFVLGAMGSEVGVMMAWA